MDRKPLECPETGELCVNGDCTVAHCVEKVRDFNRQKAEAGARFRALYAKHIKDITLDDLDEMPERQGPISN